MNAPERALVVGTAGHVDHGKSALVKALTGTDPDRLQEEKRRGMTIDLGFAALRAESGETISIVDVPGHERFVSNMIAGATGIQAMLLVVAADEGVQPQTQEHVAIVDLLGIRRTVVAVTKIDLVDEELLELAEEEVGAIIAATDLQVHSLVRTSVVQDRGIDQVRAALGSMALMSGNADAQHPYPLLRNAGRREQTLKPHQRDVCGEANLRPGPSETGNVPRLPVDRVFSVHGFGTVVTGTLSGGEFATGDEVEILPQGLPARIRGIQSHGVQLDMAAAGSRVALNLAGPSRGDLSRGSVVALPGTLPATRRFEARIRVLPDHGFALRRGMSLSVHAGAAEVVGRVYPLDATVITAGDSGWVEVRLEQPVPLWRRQPLILRTPSPSRTVGGGLVADLCPPRRRPRNRSGHRADLASSDLALAVQARLSVHPRSIPDLALLATASADRVEAVLRELCGRRRIAQLGSTYFDPPHLESLKARAIARLETYHERFPQRAWMRKEELRRTLRLQPPEFNDLTQRLADEGRIRASGRHEMFKVQGSMLNGRAGRQLRDPPGMARPLNIEPSPLNTQGFATQRHVEALQSAAASSALPEVLRRLDQGGFAPPPISHLVEDAGVHPEQLRTLVESGSLIRFDQDTYLSAETWGRLVDRVVGLLEAEGTFTVARLRDTLDTSRKYVLLFLQRLDGEQITVRAGDERVAGKKLRAHRR